MSDHEDHTPLDPEDDAPDLSAPEWVEKMSQAVVHRGKDADQSAAPDTP